FAMGTGNRCQPLPGIAHLFYGTDLVFGKTANTRVVGARQVLFHLFESGHARKYHTNLRLVPQPLQCPFSWFAWCLSLIKHTFYWVWWDLNSQFSAFEWFHDYY